MSEDEGARIVEKCDITLKLLDKLTLEMGHWIAKKRSELEEMRKKALEGLSEEEKG